MTDKFIPRILLCGDAEIFLRDGRQIELVGQFDCDDGKIFSDDAEIPAADAKILFDAADYVVFDDRAKFATNFDALSRLAGENKLLTLDSFLKFAGDNFFALDNVKNLLEVLTRAKISRLLDADKFFSRNEVFATFAHGFEVDGLDENFSVRKFPLVENLYRKIFATLDDCRFQTYDAILLTADRSPDEIFNAIVETDAVAEKILLFVRKNSPLESWLNENSVAFANVENFPAVNGFWALLTKISAPEDVFVCCVEDVPENPDFRDLRRYLGDELPALHWLWKNTRYSTLGLVDGDFSSQEAENFLRGCDMLVAQGEFSPLTPHEQTISLCGQYLNEHVEKIFRKHIKIAQPDYLSAFDFVSDAHCLIPSRKFVTRRKIFDSYCAWLFSFVEDVAREVLSTTNLSAVENPQKYRVVALISERLLTVWLAKNNLRLVPAL